MHIFFSMEWKSQTAESHKLTSENVDTEIWRRMEMKRTGKVKLPEARKWKMEWQAQD